MLINVKINSMKDAEHFSNIVRRYPAEITLKADKFCVDPKSALGVLAILYSARDNMMLDTGDMDDGEIPQLVRDIKDYNSVTRPTSRLVQNYSYLNMSSLSVGYEFKRDMIRKLGLYRLKLQFNCRDLFTASSIQVERGLSSPYARAFTLSVNASF